MLRLIRARRFQEVLEPRAVRPLRRFAGHGDRGLQHLADQRLDEGILRGESSIERAHPDARHPRHVSHAGFQPLLLEDLAGRHQQALPVLPRRRSGLVGRPLSRSASLRAAAGLLSGEFTPVTVGEAERSVHFAPAGANWRASGCGHRRLGTGSGDTNQGGRCGSDAGRQSGRGDGSQQRHRSRRDKGTGAGRGPGGRRRADDGGPLRHLGRDGRRSRPHGSGGTSRAGQSCTGRSRAHRRAREQCRCHPNPARRLPCHRQTKNSSGRCR